MALSTWKREPRQAGNGATVARKGVTGPFPICAPKDLRAFVGPDDGCVDSRGAGINFPVVKRAG